MALMASPFSVFADDAVLNDAASAQLETEAPSMLEVPVESAPVESAPESATPVQPEEGVVTAPVQDALSADVVTSDDAAGAMNPEDTPRQESPTADVSTQETQKANQPSMIADRSNEGQPFVLGETTFRGGKKKTPVKFYSSNDKIFPAKAQYGVILTADGEKVDIEETKKLYGHLGAFVEDEISKLGKYEILTID